MILIVAGILTPLENVMKSILDFFHGNVGLSWAWSIVALTVLVRIMLVPLDGAADPLDAVACSGTRRR